MVRIPRSGEHLVVLTCDAGLWAGYGDRPDTVVTQIGPPRSFDPEAFWEKAIARPNNRYFLDLPAVYLPSASEGAEWRRDAADDPVVPSERFVREIYSLATRMQSQSNMFVNYSEERGPLALPSHVQTFLFGFTLSNYAATGYFGDVHWNRRVGEWSALAERGLTRNDWSEELESVGDVVRTTTDPRFVEQRVDEDGRLTPIPVEEAFGSTSVIVFTTKIGAWEPIQHDARFQVFRHSKNTDYIAIADGARRTLSAGGDLLFLLDWKKSGWPNTRHPIRAHLMQNLPPSSRVQWIHVPQLGPLALPLVHGLYQWGR